MYRLRSLSKGWQVVTWKPYDGDIRRGKPILSIALAAMLLALPGCAALSGIGALFTSPAYVEVVQVEPTARMRYADVQRDYTAAKNGLAFLNEQNMLTPAQRELVGDIIKETNPVMKAWNKRLVDAGQARKAGLLNTAASFEADANSREVGVKVNIERLRGIMAAADRPLLAAPRGG